MSLTPQAYPTTGSVLALGNDASPEHYAQIARVGDISDVGFTTKTHETSSHDTHDGFGSIIPGLSMQKDVKVKLWFDPSRAQHSMTVADGLGKLAFDKTPKSFLFYPKGFAAEAMTFFGYITDWSQPVPVDGVLEVDFTISRTGSPEYGVDATSLVTLVTD